MEEVGGEGASRSATALHTMNPLDGTALGHQCRVLLHQAQQWLWRERRAGAHAQIVCPLLAPQLCSPRPFAASTASSAVS